MLPDRKGKFGIFGGRFAPETLIGPLEELEINYKKITKTKEFKKKLDFLLKNYAGRPTPLYFAKNLSDYLGFKSIFKKRGFSIYRST
jgi:tryptophan synthase beta chain